MTLFRRCMEGGMVIAVVTALDQTSKLAILTRLRPPGVEGTPFQAIERLQALPILDLVLTWNRGISFGMGNTAGSWNVLVFTLIAAVIGVFLIHWMLRADSRLSRIALGLVVGGALGNVIDRLRFGAVVDFLYVHVSRFDWWPVFNVADSAICIGAALLVFESLFGKRESHKNTP